MSRTDGQTSMTIDRVTTGVEGYLAAIDCLVRRTWSSNIRFEPQ